MAQELFVDDFYPEIGSPLHQQWKERIAASLADPRPSLSLEEVDQRLKALHERTVAKELKDAENATKNRKIS